MYTYFYCNNFSTNKQLSQWVDKETMNNKKNTTKWNCWTLRNGHWTSGSPAQLGRRGDTWSVCERAASEHQSRRHQGRTSDSKRCCYISKIGRILKFNGTKRRQQDRGTHTDHHHLDATSCSNVTNVWRPTTVSSWAMDTFTTATTSQTAAASSSAEMSTLW